MLINKCKICLREFTKPHNPNREFKYCSCSCMGKDKEKQKKHSLTMKGHKAWNKGIKGLQSWMNLSGLLHKTPWNKGKENPYFKGEKNPNWAGGITPINEKIRHSIKYSEWRMEVLRRDRFMCVNCGHRSNGKYKDVVVDHIKPFSIYKELRFDINNGRTLCQHCDAILGWNFYRNSNNRGCVASQQEA